jgi:hypothetical protein
VKVIALLLLLLLLLFFEVFVLKMEDRRINCYQTNQTFFEDSFELMTAFLLFSFFIFFNFLLLLLLLLLYYHRIALF